MTPLVISFTPNYIVPAAVTLRSILDAGPQGRFEVYCLVTEDIPQRQRDELSAMAGERMSFRYINLAGKLDGYYVDPRYSEAASYRLLLPELLPEVKTIVYLDCDIVVRQDIAALYSSLDLGANLLAAVYEAPIEGQAARCEALGCDPGRYFNSGFLVMNLERMRLEKTSGMLLDALRSDYLEFPDQDALNVVCKGRVLPLGPEYNSIRTFFLPQYLPDFERQYGPGKIEAVEAAGNIHYTGGKPWNLFTVRFADWWEKYDSLPTQIKSEWTPDPNILRFWRVYRTGIGRRLIDSARSVYRKIRHESTLKSQKPLTAQ